MLEARMRAQIIEERKPATERPSYAYIITANDPGLQPGEGRRQAICKRIEALKEERATVVRILEERQDEM